MVCRSRSNAIFGLAGYPHVTLSARRLPRRQQLRAFRGQEHLSDEHCLGILRSYRGLDPVRLEAVSITPNGSACCSNTN